MSQTDHVSWWKDAATPDTVLADAEASHSAKQEARVALAPFGLVLTVDKGSSTATGVQVCRPDARLPTQPDSSCPLPAAWKDDAPEEISVAQVPPFGDALLPEERSLVVLSCGIDAILAEGCSSARRRACCCRGLAFAWPRAGEDPSGVEDCKPDARRDEEGCPAQHPPTAMEILASCSHR